MIIFIKHGRPSLSIILPADNFLWGRRLQRCLEFVSNDYCCLASVEKEHSVLIIFSKSLKTRYYEFVVKRKGYLDKISSESRPTT